MLSFHQWLASAADTLTAAQIEPAEARAQAQCIAGHVLGETETLAFRLDAQRLIPDRDLSAMRALIHRRASREPLQYILNQAPFGDLTLHTRPAVLIPREDSVAVGEACLLMLAGEVSSGTDAFQKSNINAAIESIAKKPNANAAIESIVKKACSSMSANSVKPLELLDLCCGSGAIGLWMLCQCPCLNMTFADISGEALALCEENIHAVRKQYPHTAGRSRVISSDLFVNLTGRYDAILCNPPYIVQSDLESLSPEVQCEPVLALDGGPDGLSFYRLLAAQAQALLLPGAPLVVEIGDGAQPAVAALFKAQGWRHMLTRHDLNGLPRAMAFRYECKMPNAHEAFDGVKI